MNPLDTLKGDIAALIRRAESEAAILHAQIVAYREVLGSIEDLKATDTPFDHQPAETAARAPRRDVMGAVAQAVRDYMEAKGLGPRLPDLAEGASILLGGPAMAALTESAAKRAADALIAKGTLFLHGDRYAMVGVSVSRPAIVPDAAK